MKPPICFLCNKDCRCENFHFGAGGSYVQFADYKPLAEGYVGHPRGLEWFCCSHLDSAQALALLTRDEAVTQLKQQFGDFPPYVDGLFQDPELWVTAIGSNHGKVFGIIRSAMGISPVEAKLLLAAGRFKVREGWPSQLRPWAEALESAGALVEIKCP